jgi:hypothetical protein
MIEPILAGNKAAGFEEPNQFERVLAANNPGMFKLRGNAPRAGARSNIHEDYGIGIARDWPDWRIDQVGRDGSHNQGEQQ